MSVRVDPIVGRYYHIELEGRPHRLYVEEAGEGIPLICLHTAGADGRQYRGLMNDAAITRHYRVIAFDMPRHGKSSPPEGWEQEVYQLTTDAYVDMVMRLSAALELERPVVMGCSIGGRAVLHLALRHAPAFRAAIGLQSALHAHPQGGVRVQQLEWLHRSDIHGGEAAAASISGIMAPQSPAPERWETIWHYMQGGPGVFLGDLNYYYFDGDLRNTALAIDTDVCPLYLLTGEYDYSATPELSRELAAKIPGATLQIMTGLGHFPMSEHYDHFRRYLLPVLDEIKDKS